MKAVVAAFNQEKALVGAFSVITSLRICFGWNFLKHYVQGAAWAVFLASVPASLLATRPFYLERSPFLCLALLSSYNLLSLSYEVSQINKLSPRLQNVNVHKMDT